MPIDPEKIRGAEVLMHDSTFLALDDREDPTHATMAEAFETAAKAEVGALVLFHVSSRYRRDKAIKQAEKLAREREFEKPVIVVQSRRFALVQ